MLPEKSEASEQAPESQAEVAARLVGMSVSAASLTTLPARSYQQVDLGRQLEGHARQE
jgi:hypothetical protein